MDSNGSHDLDSRRSLSIVARMIGAAMLMRSVFEEIEADKSATMQAVLVVIVVSIATGLGVLDSVGLRGMLFSIPIAIVSWVVLAWIVFQVGTKMLPVPETHADWGQLARTVGFAQAPGVFKVFGILPGAVGDVILLIVSLWMLIAMVVAVRHALDYTSTARAIGVVLLGFIPYMLLLLTLLALLGNTQT